MYASCPALESNSITRTQLSENREHVMVSLANSDNYDHNHSYLLSSDSEKAFYFRTLCMPSG